MSMFETRTITCPACGTARQADLYHSVNADRRPDLRAEILDGSFQRVTCGNCHATFRADPEFNYLDIGRGQWIAAHPQDALADCETLAAADQASFERAYGPAASAGARAIGEGLAMRVVFGWHALREKLVAADAGLDDVELELLKLALLRTRDDAPLSDTVELRFAERVPEGLVLAWVDSATGTATEQWLVPRKAYDDIAANEADWAALRAEMRQGAFVDMQRLML